jgi:hypothetical protein
MQDIFYYLQRSNAKSGAHYNIGSCYITLGYFAGRGSKCKHRAKAFKGFQTL